MELLNKEEVKELINNPPLHLSLGGITKEDILKGIDELTVIESRPKGEWEVAEDLPKLDNTFSIRCSKCGQLMLAHYNDDYPNYCCNCGADMRGEE